MMASRVASIPAAFSVDVEAFEHWVAASEPGDRFRYATGVVPPHKAPAWVMARALYDEGEVTLTSGKRPDNGEWDWFAVRRAPEKPELPVIVTATAEVATGRVLRELRRCALNRLRCPTNAEIARSCGLPTPVAASYQLRKLVGAGAIRVLIKGPNAPRVVTIVSTGESTAEVA